MSDLHAAITARIEELERYAREAEVVLPSHWTVSRETGAGWVIRPANSEHDEDVVAQNLSRAEAHHMGTWDPATVLRGLAEDRHTLQIAEDMTAMEVELRALGAASLAGALAVWATALRLGLRRRHGLEIEP